MPKKENNIISFEEHRKKKEQEKDKAKFATVKSLETVPKTTTPEDYSYCVTFPLPDEIEALYFAAKQYEDDSDEAAPLPLWTGKVWEMFFEEIIYPYAGETGLDPFDVFAVFLSKMNGMKFNRDEEGFLTSLSLHTEGE